MPHKAVKTWAAIFCRLCAPARPSDKNCYALPSRKATIVFPAFGRNCFADREEIFGFLVGIDDIVGNATFEK
jgi:hypothetical protein